MRVFLLTAPIQTDRLVGADNAVQQIKRVICRCGCIAHIADSSALIRINECIAVGESIAILSATKHLGPTSEILRTGVKGKYCHAECNEASRPALDVPISSL